MSQKVEVNGTYQSSGLRSLTGWPVSRLKFAGFAAFGRSGAEFGMIPAQIGLGGTGLGCVAVAPLFLTLDFSPNLFQFCTNFTHVGTLLLLRSTKLARAVAGLAFPPMLSAMSARLPRLSALCIASTVRICVGSF